MIRHKLYLQIYAAFLGGLLLFALLAGIMWKLMSGEGEAGRFTSGMTTLLSQALPTDAPIATNKQILDELAAEFHVQLSLYDRRGKHILSTAEPLPLPKALLQQPDAHHQSHRGFSLRLKDGRWLLVSHHEQKFPTPLLAILFLLVALALAAWPLSKRLTCRIESLQARVAAFGAGDLKARATVKGKDEVADLARKFNHTADQIEQLIEAQQHTLRSASHELRSPLTRMRMAIELMESNTLEKSKARLIADIMELDDLVDELLLASKLDAGAVSETMVQLDLLALSAEMAAKHQAEVSGSSVWIRGDEGMLRRLLRNQLENANRHARNAPVQLSVAEQNGVAVLRICDDGPGIAEAERNRIFEPFYQARSNHRNNGSIGLGLSLVQKIATQHGGTVRYIESEGDGACFEVRIPVGTE